MPPFFLWERLQPLALDRQDEGAELAAEAAPTRKPVIAGSRDLPPPAPCPHRAAWWRSPRLPARSEEHTSELQSLMRISYAVFCLKKKKKHTNQKQQQHHQNRPQEQQQLTEK